MIYIMIQLEPKISPDHIKLPRWDPQRDRSSNKQEFVQGSFRFEMGKACGNLMEATVGNEWIIIP